ncbi:hypothetical protein V6N11_013990 [Hibiscus sabdariffa]|uniref:Uncharacterized protein n=1 Tax=Hibiscus sabdariffa TaxID=183260 RepID=A0ABR2AFF1_9ROSI
MYGYINSGRITLSKENSLPRSYVVKTRSTRPSSSQKPENFDRGCICPSSQPRELRIQLVGLTKPTFISLLKQRSLRPRPWGLTYVMTVRGVPPAYRPAGEGRPPFAERLAVGIHGGLPLSPDGRSAEERKPGTIPHFGTLPSAVESVQVGSGQSGGTLAGRIAFESKDVKQQALKLQEKRKSYNCYNRNADTLKGLRHQRKRMI